MAKIIWTAQAEKWLKDIYDYLGVFHGALEIDRYLA